MTATQRYACNPLVIVLPLLLAAGLSEAAVDDAELRREFAEPPLRWQSRPLWFWNGKLDAEKTKGMVAACKAAGYYGMGILPCNGMGVDFMSPEFLKHYKVAVDEAGRPSAEFVNQLQTRGQLPHIATIIAGACKKHHFIPG